MVFRWLNDVAWPKSPRSTSATVRPALRGVVGDRQPVDAAADDEDVDVAVSQASEISNHTGTIL